MDEPDAIQIRLGRAVRAVRDERGLTQEQVAAASDMHPTYLSDIERGARNPSWKALVRLSEGLGVGVSAIAAAYEAIDS